MTAEPTSHQQAILDYLTLYIEKEGHAPSLSDIAFACGLSSKGAAAHNLNRLEELGHITRDKGVPRSIRVVNQDAARR